MIPSFKLRVTPEQSETIQRLFFDLGGSWHDELSEYNTLSPFLACSENKLYRCATIGVFNNWRAPERTFEGVREQLYDAVRRDMHTTINNHLQEHGLSPLPPSTEIEIDDSQPEREIIPDFKIRVTPEQSETIQRLVFHIGGSWYDGSSEYNTTLPFLSCRDNRLYHCTTIDIFNNWNISEYIYENIRDQLHAIYCRLLHTEINNRHRANGLNPLPLPEILEIDDSQPEREPIQDFYIRVTPAQSEIVQRTLFNLGYSWSLSGTTVSHVNAHFLRIAGRSRRIGFSQTRPIRSPEWSFSKFCREFGVAMNDSLIQREPEINIPSESSASLVDVDDIIDKLQDLTKY